MIKQTLTSELIAERADWQLQQAANGRDDGDDDRLAAAPIHR